MLHGKSSLQDEWETIDTHTCLRECNCPEDGSACSLKQECKAENFACNQGYQRFSSGQARCYPVGCQEGSLKVGQEQIYADICWSVV